MKKIFIWVDHEQPTPFSAEFKQSLQRLDVDSTILNSTPQATNYQGCIILKKNLTADDLKVIFNFYEQSKPIVAFLPSSMAIAESLQPHSQLISIAGIGSKEFKNIEIVDCPADDFITDRYTKILSSTIHVDTVSFSELEKKGVWLICKELVEMA